MTDDTLTICAIAGNAEHYVDRFLDWAFKLTPNVVIVRACGNQTPDETLNIADHRGCNIAAYHNKQDWPHVDNFAAARNQSFAMARTDWIMWADMDDVIDDENIAAIKNCLAHIDTETDGIQLPYVVPEDGLTVFRERIVRRGSCQWQSPIHEYLAFRDGAKIVRLDTAHVLHRPIGERSANDERNLRILENIPESERTPSHRFHLFQSLRAVGRIAEAKNEAAKILQDKPDDIGTPERYELFIALGQLSEDPAQRAQMMLQAIGTDATRREAYGELALCLIGMGKPEQAAAMTTAMRALPKPLDADWNSRGKYYGYLGEQLHGMALRACGEHMQADVIETNHFIRHGAKISLVHATRGRVKQAVEARRKWFSKAKNPDAIEHIFGIDQSDDSSTFLTVHNHAMTTGFGGSVAAWNAAAEKSRGQIIVQMSDDWEPPLHWDELIIDAIGDTIKPAVLAVSDGGRRDDLLCMAIITRARYNQQDYLFHPDFFSVYSDNWFTDCAMRDGVLIDRRDIVFEHLHPAHGKAEMDRTYQHCNSEEAYRRGNNHYGRLLDGKITSHDIGGWCNFRDTYALMAKAMGHGTKFVEVGSWLGQSIIHFAQRCQDFGKAVAITCVDTFRGEDGQIAHVDTVKAHGGTVEAAFRSNIQAAGVADMISVIVGDSAESAECFDDKSLDGCFIDAAHSYEGCKRDLEAWFPKMSDKGIWAGHDYHWHEVKRAVDEHAAANGYRVVEMPGTVWMRAV